MAGDLTPSTLALSPLREIAQALSAAWDLDTTLDLIARRTNHVMGADSCSIYLLEPEGEILRLRASTRLARESLGRASLRLGEGLTGWAAKHGKSAAVREARLDPRFKLLPETNEEGLRSLLAVPLTNRGRVIGAMNVQTAAPRDFSEAEAELLMLIGDLAAGALDRAMLHDSMRNRLDELTTLAKVSQTVTSPMVPDQMLELVAEMAAGVMGSDVCSLQLIDEDHKELVMRAAWSRSPAYRRRPPLRIDEGIVGEVIRTGKPVAVQDVRVDPRYHFKDLARREGLVSLLSVPLAVREKVIGVMNAYVGRPVEFTPQQVALCTTLANQTALAIENARLAAGAAIVREMHHRVKNNLQTVAMLLRMQQREGDSAGPADALGAGIGRILAIAAVHETLSRQGYALVDLRQVAERIVRLTSQNMVRPDLAATITVEGDSLLLPSRPATSLALVINELLHNALEHAFGGRASGSVRILLAHTPEDTLVEILDDGVGLDGGQPRESLGLEIVRTLVREDLCGKLAFESGPEGTRATVRIPHTEAFQEAE
ncbi:MAG: GAF domain-containing protein [Anaerolineales bacterium]|nr:GAF domain-containing protein [Anaerolineales bacterium]